MFVLPQSISCDVVDIERRPAYTTIFETVQAVATGMGPLLGGVFADTNWRWAFLINLPIGTIVFLLCVWQVPSSQRTKGPFWAKVRQIDFLGILLLCGSIATILYAANAGGVKTPWDSPQSITCFAVGSATLVSFLCYESRFAGLPIIPIHLLKLRNVAGVYLQQFFFGSGYFMVLFVVPLYIQLVHGRSAFTSGLIFLAWICPICPGVAVSVLVLRNTGRYTEFITFSNALLTVSLGLLSTLRADTGLGVVVGYLALGGFAIGYGMETSIFAVQASVSKADMAVVTGIRLFVRYLGASVGIVAGSVLVIHHMLATGLPRSLVLEVIHAPFRLKSGTLSPSDRDMLVAGFLRGFQTAFQVSAALMAFTTAAAFFLIRHIDLRLAHGRAREDAAENSLPTRATSAPCCW